MDIHHLEDPPTNEEREAVDVLLGAPLSAWHGGARGDNVEDAHVAFGGREARERRHLLLPALQALQLRVGWISRGGLNYVCVRLSVPPADAWGVATFYALLATAERPRRVLHLCTDIGCRIRGSQLVQAELERRSNAPVTSHAHEGRIMAGDREVAWMPSPCLGLCDAAPAALLTEAGEKPVERLIGNLDAARALKILSASEAGAGELPDATASAVIPQQRDRKAGDPPLLLLQRAGVVDPESIESYLAAGGYQALRRALELGPERVIREVTESKLVGRGGAAFPTGRKWEAVRVERVTPHYLVCNADESEPGTFKDRALLTLDPFSIVEAMTIAAFATGCEKGFLYLRGEYPLAAARLANAIEQAAARGFLGNDILGKGCAFQLELRRGSGAYICGEETALFESIEGKRGEPRNKPPFPVQVGLFGKPTVINNVETLANVIPIVLEGGAAFARTGTAQSTGTRLFCLSGHVQRPGVYEVPFGTTLQALLDLAGGTTKERKLRAILLGGAAGGFVRPDETSLRLTHEDTRAAGVTLGSGVVMAFDDSTDMNDILLRIAAFFRDESCGQCVPCRVGTVRQEEALQRIIAGRMRGGLTTEVQLLNEVGVAMRDASICGLGQTAYSAIESAIKRLGLFPTNGATRS